MSNILRMYRGTAAAADEVVGKIEQIRQSGLGPANKAGSRKRLTHPFEDLRAAVLAGDGVPQDAFGTDEPITYACGDERSAAFYAWRSAEALSDGVPIIVEFDVEPADVTVDGNDLLLTIFCRPRIPFTRDAMVTAYGRAIEHYLDASEAMEPRERLSATELALRDPEIVLAHHANTSVIQGKFDIKYCNAFKIAAPVPNERIVDARPLYADIRYQTAKWRIHDLCVN